jgi:hypothetical protein
LKDNCGAIGRERDNAAKEKCAYAFGYALNER